MRTRRVGYLRDIRRMTVALSRARLGFYILGRRDVFESCFELREAFGRLLQRPTTLMVVPGEMHPTTRGVDATAEGTEMTGIEHLGQYVYEITQAKVKRLDAGDVDLPRPDENVPMDGQEYAEVVGEGSPQPQELEM